MAVPATKRRKLSHSPSEDGSQDDGASFASSNDGVEELDDMDDVDDVDDMEELEETAQDGHEDDNDMASQDESSHGKPKSAKKPTKTDKPKPVARASTLEASAAAYTGGTFKSNMFKLQVDEMLAQIRPRHGKKAATAEDALHTLKKTIDQVPAREAQSVQDAERELIKKSKVAIPFPDPRPAHDALYKLAYAKPANINVVGSYPLKLSTRTDDTLAIDMLVTMPASLFQDKDYLNHRYFYKRAFYLACIAAALKKSDFALTFSSFHDNPLHPILVVRHKEQKSENNWQINIIPGIQDATFARDKLLPVKNCVRPAKPDDSPNPPPSSPSLPPTPFYNSSIQADSQTTSYLRLLHTASTTCDAYKDACLLGRVWLRQRAFTSDVTRAGFGNFEWAAMMAVLLTTGAGSGMPLLSSGYSSYQLFKATLQYLATKDFCKHPAIFQAEPFTMPADNPQPVFFDGARNMNILYKMTSSSYYHLKTEARATLHMLADNLADTFESTFILRSSHVLPRYDLTVKLPVAALATSQLDDRHLAQRYTSLHAVLSRGLDDRATEVVIESPAHESWDVGSARPSTSRRGDVLVKLVLNASNVNRAVDHGPSAENKKEAASFRKFWGEKAELRRFRDGSIMESLVWSTKEGGMPIIQQIITWLLYRHFGQPAAQQAVFHGDTFAKLIKHSSGISAFQPLMEAFKTLETDIRAMEDLPLTIRSIMPADAQLRYSSVSLPLADSKRMQAPAELVLQFEGSGRWPDDLVAIQRTKIAFLLHIGQLFASVNDAITARVGLENADVDIQNQGFLDITYPSGASFRLRIHHDREQTLLSRTLSDKTVSPSTKESAALALAAYKRLYLRSPAHTQAVQKLCTRFPALSPTIRLVKKWFQSHLLSNHFADELIETFVLNTFLRPWPYTVPSSPQTGLLRTLSFLARWDWRQEPLIVDTNAELKAQDVQAISTRFEAWRKVDPSMNRVCLFVASSVDSEGTTWTDGTPAKVVAGRMTALAKAATNVVETQGLDLDAETLFISATEEYDFAIHLNPAFSAAGKQKKKSKGGKAAGAEFKNLVLQDELNPDLVGFSAIDLFHHELEQTYGQALVLFKGDDVIAGLWTPYTAPRAWKVNLAYSTIPIEKEEIVAEVNKEGILKEIARLGGDMVKKVEVNR